MQGAELAKAAADLGFDGVDITVRKGGHILPERVKQTLPELVRSYLMRRLLPAELDREAFVRLGEELIDTVERDLAGV